MAFIGESRIDKSHPWSHYVCLDLEDCEVFIPKENIPPEFLECMGFTEKEIRDFYKKNEVPVRVDTRRHDMKDIEFDEYEEVK